MVEAFARHLDLWPDLGAYDLARALIGDTEHNFTAAFIGQGTGVFGQAIEVVLSLPLLELAMLPFESVENLLEAWRDRTHVSKPSCLRIPTSLSSAANAASALPLSRFMASSTVSTSLVTFGST